MSKITEHELMREWAHFRTDRIDGCQATEQGLKIWVNGVETLIPMSQKAAAENVVFIAEAVSNFALFGNESRRIRAKHRVIGSLAINPHESEEE